MIEQHYSTFEKLCYYVKVTGSPLSSMLLVVVQGLSHGTLWGHYRGKFCASVQRMKGRD